MAKKCVGMFDRQGNNGSSTALSNGYGSAYENILGGFVASGGTQPSGGTGVSWVDLQTTDGGAIASNNNIDKALTLCTTVNGRQSKQWTVKLRIFCGSVAPTWAKNKSGGPISGNSSETLGPFWCADYQASYKDFMTKLAAKYDANPLIGEVTICLTADDSGEPCLHNAIGSGSGRTSALRTGVYQSNYSTTNTDPTQLAAVKAAMTTLTNAVWATTPVSFAFNPYDNIATGASGDINNLLIPTIDYLQANVATPKGVLENNSLRANAIVKMPNNKSWAPNGSPYADRATAYTSMYKEMAKFGPSATAATDLGFTPLANPSPICIQTATYSGQGGTPAAFQNTLEYAIWLGARMVELPSGYNALTAAQLDSYNARLTANDPVVAGGQTLITSSMTGTGSGSYSVKNGSTTFITASM